MMIIGRDYLQVLEQNPRKLEELKFMLLLRVFLEVQVLVVILLF